MNEPFSVLNIPIYAISQNILSSINFYHKTSLVIITAQVDQDCCSLTITALRVVSSHCFFNLIIGILYKYLTGFCSCFYRLVLRSTLNMIAFYFRTYLCINGIVLCPANLKAGDIPHVFHLAGLSSCHKESSLVRYRSLIYQWAQWPHP